MIDCRRKDLDLIALEILLRRRSELLATLVRIASDDAAADEIHRSIRALAGARWELFRSHPRQISRLAVFLPSNNLLYSYVLFGLIPSLYCREVIVRPSHRVADVAAAVHQCIASDPAFPKPSPVVFAPVTQRQFIATCREADAVVFTGRTENAATLAGQIPDRVAFLHFGSGPNPIVVGPEADLDIVVRAILTARLYNFGQDCLCPDIVLVHRTLGEELVDRLRDALAESAPDTRASIYRDAVVQAARFLDEHHADIAYGGRVDLRAGIVEPSVIIRSWSDDLHPPEFFAPVFHLMEYADSGQVEKWLNSPRERQRGMFVSVYAEPGLTGPVVGTSVVLHGNTTFDVEDGNRPFGGFGPQASSARHNGLFAARPLLLSAELGLAPEMATDSPYASPYVGSLTTPAGW